MGLLITIYCQNPVRFVPPCIAVLYLLVSNTSVYNSRVVCFTMIKFYSVRVKCKAIQNYHFMLYRCKVIHCKTVKRYPCKALQLQHSCIVLFFIQGNTIVIPFSWCFDSFVRLYTMQKIVYKMPFTLSNNG